MYIKKYVDINEVTKEAEKFNNNKNFDEIESLILEKENEIKAFLSRKYPGKELIYQISINPSLLGGVRIRIGNEEYDWTFAARIRQLKDAVGQI